MARALLVAMVVCCLGRALSQGPFDYAIHQFQGQCEADGTCTYTLKIPSHESLVNPGVVDNRTAAAILTHLERHDKQILQLLGYLGANGSDSSSTNLLQELKDLKESNRNLQSLVTILTSEAALLDQMNKDLAAQFQELNESLAGKTVIGGDFCGSGPCLNNATCQNLADRYICLCKDGWTGHNCETDIDECASNPCVNGTCSQSIGDYQCKCDLGFTGRNCDINIDECAANPCGIGGVCLDGIGRYFCVCEDGFTGASCEVNIDECASTPCLNGGYCLDDLDSYYCACPPGYRGERCEEDFDECEAASPCKYGTCVNLNGTYRCDCFYPEISGQYCDITPTSTCWDLRKYQNITRDGVYSITSPTGALMLANCDMTTEGGGWTRFLNRIGSAENFNRTWQSYKYGFGDLLKDFWWGNELLHTFTQLGPMEIRSDMYDWSGNSAWAFYDAFSVANESSNYRIHVGTYNGTAGDAFNFASSRFAQNDIGFTTYDRDNDPYIGNCAMVYGSGFWYNQCWSANPTGKFYSTGSYTTVIHDGIEWWPWKRDRYSLRAIDLKFRPKGAKL